MFLWFRAASTMNNTVFMNERINIICTQTNTLTIGNQMKHATFGCHKWRLFADGTAVWCEIEIFLIIF